MLEFTITMINTFKTEVTAVDNMNEQKKNLSIYVSYKK